MTTTHKLSLQIQRLKREKIALANGTMQTLLLDAKKIDSLLQEVRDYQTNDIKIAENNCEEFLTLMGEESLPMIKEDIETIDEFRLTSEQLKTVVWEDRLESNRIQTAVVDQDARIDVKNATLDLKYKIEARKKKTAQLKADYEDFVTTQKRRYDKLLQAKREEAELKRLQRLRDGNF